MCIYSQEDVEAKVVEVYHRLRDSDIGESVYLMRHKHLAYLRQGIRHLPSAFSTLDASQPWVSLPSLNAIMPYTQLMLGIWLGSFPLQVWGMGPSYLLIYCHS